MAPKKEKKPKLSKAEKKRLKAEEAEQQRRFIKRQQLTKEIRLGELTLQKHEHKWREMLIKISLPHVREELEYVWHIFERTVDAKDFQISLLMDDLDDAGEQYMNNFRSHCSDIDRLITMFRDRLLELKENNDIDIANMRAAQDAENYDYQNYFVKEQHFFKVTLFGLEKTRKEQEDAAKADYISRLEDEHSKLMELLQKQRAILEAIMNGIWEEYKRLFKKHLTDTEERRKGYMDLKLADDRMAILLTGQLTKIQKFYELMRKLTMDYNILKYQQDQKIRDLQIERQYFSDKLTGLKNRLVADSIRDRKKLALVTNKSNQIMERFHQIENMGILILKAVQITRQLETRTEKVLAFPESGIEELNFSVDGGKPLETKMAILDNLRNFWQRVAQADILRFKLKQELERLQNENFELQRKIHAYCDCAVCIADPPVRPSRRLNVPSVVDGACAHKWML